MNFLDATNSHHFTPGSLRNSTAPDPLPRPLTMGHSHDSTDTSPAPSPARRNGLGASLPPFAEALRRLETKLTAQYANLQAAFTSSLKDVVLVCADMVEQSRYLGITMTEMRSEMKEVMEHRTCAQHTRADFLEPLAEENIRGPVVRNKLMLDPLVLEKQPEDKGTNRQQPAKLPSELLVFGPHKEGTGAGGAWRATDMDLCANGAQMGLLSKSSLEEGVSPLTHYSGTSSSIIDIPIPLMGAAARQNTSDSPYRHFESDKTSISGHSLKSAMYASKGSQRSKASETRFSERPSVILFESEQMSTLFTPKVATEKRSLAFFPEGSRKGAGSHSHHSKLSSRGISTAPHGHSVAGINFGRQGTLAGIMFKDERRTSRGSVASSCSDAGLNKIMFKSGHWATDVCGNTHVVGCTICMIFLHAVYIGFDVAWVPKATTLYNSDWYFIVGANFFCAYFLLDWCLTFHALKHKVMALTWWVMFLDTGLVFLTALVTWIIEPILYRFDVGVPISPTKVICLLSFARLSRVVRAVPELYTLMRGIIHATRAVTWSLAMVFCITYMFGIFLTLLFCDEGSVNSEMGKRNFQNLKNTMSVLVFDAALLEEFGNQIVVLTSDGSFKSVVAIVVMFIYMFITNLTILNLLTGAMLEVTKALTAEVETDKALQLMKGTILEQLAKFDDGDGLISQEELRQVMCDEESDGVLRSLNVDRVFLLEMQTMLFPDENSQVSVGTIVELMLLCRGSNVTTVRTMASGLLYISSLISDLDIRLRVLVSQMNLMVGSQCCQSAFLPLQSPAHEANDGETQKAATFADV